MIRRYAQYGDPAGPKTLLRVRAERVLGFAFRGVHNVPGRIVEFGPPSGGSRVEVCAYGSIATWDFDQLTRLVIAAHRERVRVEVCGTGGPRRLRLILTLRKAFADAGDSPFMLGHPSVSEMLERHGERLPAVTYRDVVGGGA